MYLHHRSVYTDGKQANILLKITSDVSSHKLLIFLYSYHNAIAFLTDRILPAMHELILSLEIVCTKIAYVIQCIIQHVSSEARFSGLHLILQSKTRAASQYPKRRLFVRSRKVSKPRDWYFKLSYRFEIWLAHRQHCCRSACQISERSDNSKYKSRGFETLRDLTERRLFGYWDGALTPKWLRCQYKCGITNNITWFILYIISQEICTRFCCALLCCGYTIVHNEFTWSIYPYSSGLLCWHWGNR